MKLNLKKYTPKDKEQENKQQNTNKAGAQAPAFAPSVQKPEIKAKSFEEYRALRRKQEEEAGMRSAAENLANQYGYKNIAGKAVYVTPYSPLPKPTKQNTVTKAQMPGAYGIEPEQYVSDMRAIRNYMTRTYDEETQEFLDKYFNGQLPNEEMFQSNFKHYARGGVETEPDVMNFHRGAELVRKATEERKKAQQEYEEAIGRLGEDVKNYVGLTDAELYETYGNVYGAKGVAQEYADYSNLPVQSGFDSIRRLLQTGPKASNYTQGVLHPELYRDDNMPEMPASSVLAFANMTPEQREAYLALAGEYGEEAATDYFDTLRRDEGFNQQAYERRDAALRKEADEDPVGATIKSVLTSPAQIAGTAYAIGAGISGNEIDPYNDVFMAGQMVQTPRQEIGQNITESLGKVDETTGEVKDTFASVLGRGAYNAATSAADSILASNLGLGNPEASAVLQGAMQLGNTAQDVTMRGGSIKQALGLGTVDAAIEAATEYIPAENLINAVKDGNVKTIKDFLKHVTRSVLGEGPGEGLSELGTAAADKAIMKELSEWDQIANEQGDWAAAKNLIGNTLEAALAGTLSGAAQGVYSGGISYAGNARTESQVQKELAEAAKTAEEIKRAENAPQEQPVNQTKDRAEEAVTSLESEYMAAEEKQPAANFENWNEERGEMREEREKGREYTDETAQEEQQRVETPKDEQEQAAEEKAEETASEDEKEQMLNTPRTATMRTEGGEESSVNVVGVMMNDGDPVLVTENENGERDYVLPSELDMDDETGELLNYEGINRMDGRALRNYLEGYDSRKGSVEAYASAYSSVYQRARSGLDYEQAALQNDAREYLSEDAMLDAYSAGLNAYNQAHETVQPAAVESVQNTDAPAGTVMSAKETKSAGKISKQYSQRKFSQLSKDQRRNAIAQMEVLKALASRTGRTITIVDSITDGKGGRANALYNPQTGEIRVALDAEEGAYAYAAMHELTHAMRHEYSSEWSGFVDYVRSALKNSGQNWDELVKYQQERFGYDRNVAEEEVMCNTVPALLKDESNVLKLYKGNRKLFTRVVDWVKGLLKDMKAAGEALSKRSKSWEQMDALAMDRKTLQEIYDRMMAVMEKPAERAAASNAVKMSKKEEHYDYSRTFAQQIDDWLDGKFPENDTFLVSSTPEVLQKIGFAKLPMSYDQKHMRQVLGKAKNRDHDLGVDFMKALPELIADPVAIIDNPTETGSIMMVLAHQNKNANDRPVVGIVRVEKGGGYNKVYVDANKLETVHSRGNLDEIIRAAVEKEKAGGVGVYYVTEKNSLRSVLEHGQSQVLDSLNRTGYMHSIHDAGSDVNAELMDQTESRQFKRWFGNSKVVNEDGSPKMMYRGGNEDIEIFDRRKSKASNLYGRGFYFTESEEHAKQYGGVNSYYLRIEHPLDASSGDKQINQSQMRNFLEAVAEDEDYGLENYGYGATVDSVLRSLRGKDDFAALQDINATAVGDFVAAIELFNEVNGTKYDGIITPTETVVFDSRQIKSATDNAGTFDPENPNVKFSMRDSDENVQDAISAEQKAYEQVTGHRITAMEADKLAGEILKLANSDYSRQQLAAEISRIYDYIERGEDVDWNQVNDEMTRLMAKVMEKSRTLNIEHEEMAQPIREYLRTTGIRLTDKQRTEAANKAGSYNAYRKTMFGRVRLVSVGGTRLDSAWAELNEMNSELFPPDASEGDQAMLLMNAVDALKPVYSTGMGMSEEEGANWLTGKLNEAYFALPAVKAAAKNARAFGENVEAAKKAMKRFEETSWSEYQNALRGIQEARGAQKRSQQQEEAAAMREKYAKWRERDTAARKEREMKTKYRAKIERTVQTLTNWMMKPTDAKHVPAGVEDSVRRMLESLDFSGKSTKTARQLSDQLDNLANALQNAQEGEDENRTIFLERDQQMIDEIRRVAELIRGNTDHQQTEGRGVYDLNGMELRELSKWMDVVKHVITEASKLRGSNLPGESVEQVATMSMMEIGRKKAWKDKKWATQKWLEHFGPDMQDSFTFFERLGPTTNAIFGELREGFDKVTRLIRQAEEHTRRILDGVNLAELSGKKAKKVTFELESGKLEMTKAEIMELYVLSKREQAQGRIYGQGIRLKTDKDARPHSMTKQDVARITDALTEDEKRVADGLQKFLSNECASWGNETSLKLLGYRKFGEENYWPISTDPNTRNTTKLEENYAANIAAIKNQGMTKATVEGAQNAIMIGDIFDTYTRHISNMSAYAGYALPLSDFTRWYNSRGVKTEIEHVMGKKGLTYINNFLMAVNGSALQADQSGIERLAGKLSRNAKIASVGANMRVVIQQPTSYVRAAMYMSPKYLIGALGMRSHSAELINKYCGIAQWKNWGFYETNVGPNLRQMIVGDDTLANRARELAMKPAALGDEWTLNRLWNACVLETQDLMPELERGSQEYYQQIGKRMSEIIDRTQVVDSVFHRSQMMRSKSGTAQMLTNFMSEPTKTYNMLMSAISDYADNRQNKAARNRVARAFTVYAVSGLLTAAAAAVIDAFRDEDAEKEWLEKYLDAAEENAVDNLNPLGLLPGVKDIMSMLQGYEPSRLDTQSIQKLIWAAQEIQKYADGTSKMNLYGVSYKTAQALSSLFGIPVSNVMRDINSAIQTATGQSITKTPQARKNDTLTQLYQAITDGKTARAKKLREDLRIKAGMTPKEIDTRLAEMLKTDPKVAEAYAAKDAKDYAKMNRAINALTSKGFGRETVENSITSYAADQKPKEPKTKNPGEQLAVTFYSEADVVTAMKILAGVEKGGSVTEADVRAMISECEAGSEAKDPEASVKSGIQSELKKEYLAAEAKGNTDAMRRIGSVMSSVLDTKQDDMDRWVRDQHSENLRTAIDSYNRTAALKAVTIMRKDGKTDSEIKSSLNKYKQLYIDAVARGDKVTANKIKNMLMSLGLVGKNGKSLYTDKHFEDWLKEK